MFHMEVMQQFSFCKKLDVHKELEGHKAFQVHIERKFPKSWITVHTESEFTKRTNIESAALSKNKEFSQSKGCS